MMSPVSVTRTQIGVLGTGSVGAALTRALLAGGHTVIAWNRTPERLDPLVVEGAVRADDAAEVARGAETVFLTLADHDAFETIVDEIADADIADRLFVQLASGSAARAEALGQKVHSRGARYLEGLLVSYPSALLDGTAILYFSGAEVDFERLREGVLEPNGWNAGFAGEQLGRAKQISHLFEAACTNAIAGFLLGAALADAIGMPVRQYAELIVPPLLPTLAGIFTDYTDHIASGNFQGEMSMELWHQGVRRQILEAEQLGVDPASLRVVASQMERCIEAGLGSCDIAALFAVIRNRGGE